MVAEKNKPKQEPAQVVKRIELGRNDPCHCGSGKKYKHCHLEQDEEAERKRRALETSQAAAEAKTTGKENKPAYDSHVKNTKPAPPAAKAGFNRTIFNRKTGDT